MPTLMVSISGIRGIIGSGLEPEVIVKYISAYADLFEKGRIVVGRDARISGKMVEDLVTGTLKAKGMDVIRIGICPTPTVQYTVKTLKAQGGIAISASHNPNEWNALKLLNGTGQFLSPGENEALQRILSFGTSRYAAWNGLGKEVDYNEGLNRHIKDIMNLKYISKELIRKKRFRVLADCVNGAGVYSIPVLLKEFGCEVIEMNCEKTGIFPRLPEPLPENLNDTMKWVKETGADLGIAVDPDVDRLVLITENGEPFGEENTVVLASKHVLSREKGNVVINLSTTRAVEDIAAGYGCKVFRSPVGEANVVQKMKETNAVIGGEGSGGVILPALHYGRDALAGIALILQYLSECDLSLSEVKNNLPQYFIGKTKIDLQEIDPQKVIDLVERRYGNELCNKEDGLRIDFPEHWVHFRKSNTEPIIRIIVESRNETEVRELIKRYKDEIGNLIHDIS